MIKQNIIIIYIVVILSMLTAPVATAGEIQEVDTTSVRDVQKIKKSTGEKILDIPGEILKLPVYLIEFTSYTIATNPPLSIILPLVSFGKAARPYVPVVGYSSKAGVKLGLSIKGKNIFQQDDYARLKWYYSTHHYQSYRLKYHRAHFLNKKNSFDLEFSYKKKPRNSFYGIGNASLLENEADYAIETTDMYFKSPYKLNDIFGLEFNAGYIHTNLYDGSDDDLLTDLDSITNNSIYNLSNGHFDNSRYLFIGASFDIDTRDNRGQPSKGNQLILSYSRYVGLGISERNDLNKLSLDLRHYQHVWKKRLFAYRFYIESNTTDCDCEKTEPFYLTPSLGGISELRGYNSGRFIDNDIVLFSIEYRYPIYDNIDAFVFMDEGRSFDNVYSSKFWTDWHYSAGFGLRVWNLEGVVVMGQIAKSKDATKIYIEMGAQW